jgi:hypothetical protein
MTRYEAFLTLHEPANGWPDAATARAAFLAFERDRLVAAGAEPARQDPDGNATPKTRLIGHARRGDCIGPGSFGADAIEDTTTGERAPLTPEPRHASAPALDVVIGPVDAHNPGCGYQIRVEHDGALVLLTAEHPVTGATLDYAGCLEVAAMYGPAQQPRNR